MGKSKDSASNLGIWATLFVSSFYKRNQGRLIRQLTAVALGVAVIAGFYTFSQAFLQESGRAVKVGVPFVLIVAGLWVVFRIVNLPRFADFLISVEGEVDKIAWASKQELIRSTLVVLGTMFLMGFLLLLFDFFWQQLFRWLHVLEITA
ncbi:MAG: preprotein translocase subunit SecE [Planctomycetota bacterium]|nr:preprotein translocase subunit SecE [Planctomycetota bacterium]